MLLVTQAARPSPLDCIRVAKPQALGLLSGLRASLAQPSSLRGPGSCFCETTRQAKLHRRTPTTSLAPRRSALARYPLLMKPHHHETQPGAAMQP
jgi:hypothetical protein